MAILSNYQLPLDLAAMSSHIPTKMATAKLFSIMMCRLYQVVPLKIVIRLQLLRFLIA